MGKLKLDTIEDVFRELYSIDNNSFVKGKDPWPGDGLSLIRDMKKAAIPYFERAIRRYNVDECRDEGYFEQSEKLRRPMSQDYEIAKSLRDAIDGGMILPADMEFVVWLLVDDLKKITEIYESHRGGEYPCEYPSDISNTYHNLSSAVNGLVSYVGKDPEQFPGSRFCGVPLEKM